MTHWESNARRYPARTPLPPGYAVEWWESNEMYQWVLLANPDVCGPCCWNHWYCWRSAWAHYRAGQE